RKNGQIVKYSPHYQQGQQLTNQQPQLLTQMGTRWRVDYTLLFKIMDSQARQENNALLLEGQLAPEQES
ncbi:hypothetical protein, partial [Candidatus Magnetaquicoccus inordinatus]|uniref:hypothetical protein n=1 Tax=Candidatus Magnetaquicoccus inordinatus TaxID=2496818 RepID=UPI00187D3C93